MPPIRRRFVWELDWNLLRTFMVIVQEKGLTAAGERLSLKQPSVSNALKRLETHMNCRLVERDATRFEVTPAGKKLYAECIAVFDIVSDLPQQMEERPGELTGHIDLSMASHVVCPLLDDVLRAFHQDYPQVTFSTEIMSSREVIAALLSRGSGIGICLMHERHPRLEYELLYRETFGYFYGPGHRLFGQTSLELESLREEAYVSFGTDRMSDALWPVALLRREERFLGPIIGVSTHLEEVKRLIVAGFGFGPLPVHVVEDDIAAGRLWRLPPYDKAPVIDVFLVEDPSARKTKPEALLLARIREAIGARTIAERTYPLPG